LYFRKLIIKKLTTKNGSFTKLDNVHSSSSYCYFCLLAFIIGDIFNSGGFNSTSKDVGSIDGKDISLKILE
jgi:hypothetical protein